MRLRLVALALCLPALACYSSPGDGDGFSGSETATSLADPTGDEPSPTSGADAAGSSGATSTTSTTTSTTDAWSTGELDTGAQATTSGAASTTGEPEDPCPRVRVVVPPGEVLNIRPTPSTAMAAVGTLANGAIVDVLARVAGESIEGNDQWVQIDGPIVDGYVWSGLVECTQDEAPTDGFFLPLECGMMATVSQGNFGDFSHQGQSAYAFDFQLGTGTPLVAIADGTVSFTYAETMPGDPCYDGGGQECINAANVVTLLHGVGTTSVYGHLSEVQVEPGELVPRGLTVGLSGSTGWSTGPHAHVARQENCNFGWCQSIAVSFVDVPGDGVPKTGDIVTSSNCP
jgi:murein DD-endopeptidase MepM/ murein hydrolase activator NlpD